MGKKSKKEGICGCLCVCGYKWFTLLYNAKECANYHTIALISHASKVMLKILQARLQQYVNHELTDVQAGFRKGRDQIANIRWTIKKAREFQKNIYFCFIDYAKAFDCVDHNKLFTVEITKTILCQIYVVMLP